jgi:hypothetical protein
MHHRRYFIFMRRKLRFGQIREGKKLVEKGHKGDRQSESLPLASAFYHVLGGLP